MAAMRWDDFGNGLAAMQDSQLAWGLGYEVTEQENGPDQRVQTFY